MKFLLSLAPKLSLLLLLLQLVIFDNNAVPSPMLSSIRKAFSDKIPPAPPSPQSHRQQFYELPAIPYHATNLIGDIQQSAGPFLKFKQVQDGKWYGSVLIVSLQSVPPSLVLRAGRWYYRSITAQKLSYYGHYNFWRFDLDALPMDKKSDTKFTYQISLFNPNEIFEFYVAPESAPGWRWAFTSCNGFSLYVPAERRTEMGGLQPLWRDMKKKHDKNPFHVLVGGGDQLYTDEIWRNPSLQQWLEIKGKRNREYAPWTQQMESEAHQFYFQIYMKSFTGEIMRDIFARIPQVNMCDDHDFWDGLGSNADYLERSNVFRNLKRVGYYYYLLFQHQITPQEAMQCVRSVPRGQAEYFGVERGSYSVLKQLGTEVALLALDCRGERTGDAILTLDTWNEVWDRLSALPPTVKHLIVVTGIPVVYPSMQAVEALLKCVGVTKLATNKASNLMASGISGCARYFFGDESADNIDKGYAEFKQKIGKKGTFQPLLNQFGEVELDDDLLDHWTHKRHQDERKYMVKRLQELSHRKGLRVTFLAGDVHCCAVGRLFAKENEKCLDYRLMYQIVSSAIGNVPPPDAVLRGSHWSAKTPTGVTEDTMEDMLNFFDKDVDGKPPALGEKLLGRRNYCTVKVCPEGLQFDINVENIHHTLPSVPYTVRVPHLLQE